MLGRDGERPEKFLLGSFVKHKSLTVGELVNQSIEEHLERTTFNNAREIARLLSQLGIDLVDVKVYFSDLDELAARRHQIAHRCDFAASSPRYKDYALTPIESADVLRWSKSVDEFGNLTMKQLAMVNLLRFGPMRGGSPD